MSRLMIRALFDRGPQSRRRRPGAPTLRPRPEVLEGRALLSTLFVDDDGQQCPDADYTTIQEAINAADPGDTIEVCPGTYRGGNIVYKDDLTIEAHEGLGTVFVVNTQGVGPAFGFLVTADRDTIRGFDISGFAFHPGAAGIIVGPRLLATEPTPDPTPNPGPSPTPIPIRPVVGTVLERNEVHRNGDGIVLRQSLRGTVRGNLVHDNFGGFGEEGDGVVVFAFGANTLPNVVEHNLVYNHKGAGIFVGVRYSLDDPGIAHVDVGGTRVAHNDVAHSGTAGILIVGADGVAVGENRVHDNRGVGILVAFADRTVAAANNVGNNGGDGIAIVGSGGATLVANGIHDNGGNGITIKGSHHVKLGENVSGGNAGDGVLVAGSRSVTVRSNSIAFNRGSGVAVVHSAGTAVGANALRDNARAGLNVADSVDTSLAGNTVRDSGGDGIRVASSRGTAVTQNTVRDSARDGISVADSLGTRLLANTSRDNTFDGIRVVRSHRTVLSGNTARDNGANGIHLVRSDDSLVVANRATTNGADGILVNASARVLVQGNTARENAATGIHVTDSERIAVLGNTADSNRRGIAVSGTTGSTFARNSAHGNVLDFDSDAFGDNVYLNNSGDTANPSLAFWGIS